MEREDFTYTAEDQVEIAGSRWLPDQEVRAVVQIVHGMAEHCIRYGELAEYLNRNGIAVYAEDHRGHGRTAGSPENTGYLADENGWDKVLSDVHLLTERIRKEHPSKSLFLLGHSMGSFLARNYLMSWSGEVEGAVIVGTNFMPKFMARVSRFIAGRERKKKGARTRSPLLTQLSFGSYNKPFEGRTEFDWLSRNEANVDAYNADPYCGFVCTNGFYCDLLGGLIRISEKEAFLSVRPELPVLLLAGDKDPVGEQGKGPAKVYQQFKKTGHRDTTLILVPDDRHEVLNEIDRKDVWEDLLEWLEKRF